MLTKQQRHDIIMHPLLPEDFEHVKDAIDHQYNALQRVYEAAVNNESPETVKAAAVELAAAIDDYLDEVRDEN